MLHTMDITSEELRMIINYEMTYVVSEENHSFYKGDYIGLNELADKQDNIVSEHTGSFLLAKITNVSCAPELIKGGHLILSIRPCSIREVDWDFAPWYPNHKYLSGESSSSTA
jgi:hypothetical protein